MCEYLVNTVSVTYKVRATVWADRVTGVTAVAVSRAATRVPVVVEVALLLVLFLESRR